MTDNKVKALAEKYGIVLIYLFGSQAYKGLKYLKGEGVMPDAVSDLDVAIAFENPQGETIKTYGIVWNTV